MRDQHWLNELVERTWNAHFNGVSGREVVQVIFGRRAKTRLGSIRLGGRSDRTVIMLNGLFQDPAIPEFIVQSTLVHELCHFAHGFHSPHPQKYRHPHANGVMRAEFKERGLEEMYLRQKKWLKEHWPKVVAEHFPQQPRVRRQPARVPKPWWI